jgi:4-deoxy-L-threo-5-hexosulose-uronate ketol-isomerase
MVGGADVPDCAALSADQRRGRFLLADLFRPGELSLVHWDVDRTIIGSAVPLGEALTLQAPPSLRAPSFLERRELGIINLGGPGSVECGGERYSLDQRDGLYLGRGSSDPVFRSVSAEAPARFYLLSYPAHRACPAAVVRFAEATGDFLGQRASANERDLYKYFAPGKVETCQLVMGFTAMRSGSVWNTMPPHTHARRSEVYCYFDVAPGEVVFHFMGEPANTSHLVVQNLQAVLSPSWSIHSGAGTAAYSFVWGMGGENQDFADMDKLVPAELK